MLSQFTVLKGLRAFFAASAGLVISSLCCAGGVRCLVSIGCNFLVKYMGMTELCFNYISALRTLNRVLLGSVTCMIGSMTCKIALLCAACCLASMPVTAGIICPAGSRIVTRQSTVFYTTNIAFCLMLAGGNICAGRGMRCFGTVNNDAATYLSTGLPVIFTVAVPSRSRCVIAGSNRCIRFDSDYALFCNRNLFLLCHYQGINIFY